MYLKLILALAASVFFAFVSLSPSDLIASRSSAAPIAAEIDYDEITSLASAIPPGAPEPDPTDLVGRASSAAVAVETAYDRIIREIPPQSHPDALRYAFRAYFNYRATYPQDVRKPYLYFVDFGQDSHTPRGYVFDMNALTVVEGPFNVAHGRGSVSGDDTTPTRFLNRNGSNATSLGLYLAQETYAFNGKSGGRSYRSVGLRLQGVSGRFNDAARRRGIVVHGAPYVTDEEAGRSEGCPAMPPELAAYLIPQIADGGMVFLFSPNDERWLRSDPWAAIARPHIVGS
jgi:hypothetical protein